MAEPTKKSDIKPDVPAPDPVATTAAAAPPERKVTRKLDGYTIEYKGNPDTGWLARTVYDDGTEGAWGKCDGPPKDAKGSGKETPPAPPSGTKPDKPA